MTKFFKKYLLFALIFFTLCFCNSNNDLQPFKRVEILNCSQIGVKSINGGRYDLFTFDKLNNLIKQEYLLDSTVYIYDKNNLIFINNGKQYHLKYNAQSMVSEVYLYDKYGKTGTSYSLFYDKINRLSKWVHTNNYYKNGNLNYGNIESITTREIEYDKDGNVVSIEVEVFEKDIDWPSNNTIDRSRIEYSQYDQHPNAFQFLINSFYLPLILDYSNSFYFFPNGFGLSKNNPQVEKRYYWSENKYKFDKTFIYSLEYSDDLVSKIYKKGESLSILQTFSFTYKYRK